MKDFTSFTFPVIGRSGQSTCDTCKKAIELSGPRGIGSPLSSMKSGGKLIDYCSRACRKASARKADCGLCDKYYAYGHGKDVIIESLQCPGCCGSVARNTFCDPSDPFVSYICGTGYTKIGPHGSLAYIRPGDARNLQAALDEEFVKKQAARHQEKVEFDASGEKVKIRQGCFPGVEVHYVPQGRLDATTHGVDCSCLAGLQ